jgi:Domain of unknown function (DUF4384)
MFKPPTLLICAALALGGCASLDPQIEVANRTAEARLGPQTPPGRAITGFTDSLRCMDELLLFHGVRDVTVMVEDLGDSTKKLSAGTREMLISAVSEATKRSRGVKLITFGPDVGNLAAFMTNAQSNSAFKELPMFNIRGSVSQFDDNVMRKQIDGGVALAGVSAGAARSASFAVIGIDLNVISTDDFSLVPGVTTRNQVAVFKSGSGVDGEAEYKKFGINFSQTLQRAEGQSQALRTLVELGVVELFGRLFRMPYWKCLGVSAAHDAVRQETADWYYMLSNNSELVPWMQIQLRNRGAYSGPIDGKPNAAYLAAVQLARKVLGLAPPSAAAVAANSGADPVFFERLLDQFERRMDLLPRLADRTPLDLRVEAPGQGPVFTHGQRIQLAITPSRDAYVYCYMQDTSKRWMRILPNPLSGAAMLPGGITRQLPGTMAFELVAEDSSKNGTGHETIACYATAQDVTPLLPRQVLAPAFQYLTIHHMADLDSAFARASANQHSKGVLDVRFK